MRTSNKRSFRIDNNLQLFASARQRFEETGTVHPERREDLRLGLNRLNTNLTDHANPCSHLPPDAYTITMASRIATVVSFASRIVFEGLHVKVRRSHAVIATFVPKPVASGTALEDIVVPGVLSR